MGSIEPGQFSYVMTFRADRDRRDANLEAVLRWLSHMPRVEVVLVEQDRVPRVKAGALPANCNYHFVENGGPFNKAWGLNVAFRRCSGNIIGFADADLIIDTATLIACYERCQTEFRAMKPYDRLVDLTVEESQSVLNGGLTISVSRRGQPRNREAIGEYVCFCGGLFMIRRGEYEKLGGYDERFLGWGGEDDAMTAKLCRLVECRGIAQDRVAYHLWHERSVASRYLHPHYRQNLALVKWYSACDSQSLRKLCQDDRETMGRPDKYANP